MAAGTVMLNPHLDLSLNLFGEAYHWAAVDPAWRKWKSSEPTSPHWYTADSLKRLIAAYIAHDAEQDKERTVRDFISEFRGLTGTGKRSQVLEALGLSQQPLSYFVNGGDLDDSKQNLRSHSHPLQCR